MKIIMVKIPEEAYNKLIEKARSQGYVMLTDYVRDLLLREAGFGEVVEKPTEKPEVDVDEVVSKAVSRAERKIMDLVNPFTAKVDEIARRLGEVLERIESLEEEVKKVKEELGKVKEQAAHISAQPSPPRPRKSAIDRLREQGAVFESDVKWLRDRDAFFDRLEREGAVIITVAGERVALDPGFWEKFKSKVAEITTTDEEQIKLMLSRVEMRLFEKLKRAGLLYYDATAKAWRLTATT